MKITRLVKLTKLKVYRWKIFQEVNVFAKQSTRITNSICIEKNPDKETEEKKTSGHAIILNIRS